MFAIWQSLDRLSNEAMVGMFAILAGLLLLAVIFLGGYWYHLRKHQLDIALKQDMLNRGMPADDIQKIIEASPGRSQIEQHDRIQIALKEKMIDKGLPADEIEHILNI